MPALPLFRLLLVALGLLLPATRPIAQELDLYEGEVVVPSQADAERRAALPRALAQVFVKLTGDARADQDPLLGSRLADAGRLLQRYRYRQDVVPEAGGARVRLFLLARFDPAGVDALLADAGRAVWPTPRPAPLLWLAIDDGRGPRLVANAQAAAVSALTTRARNRGLRVAFPLLDLEDQRAIAVEDVWNGRHEATVAASGRYQAPVQLVGRMQRSGSSWDARWTLLDGGQVLHAWNASDPDPVVVLAAGADGAADALTARYAVPATAGEPGRYPVLLVGLGSAEDYLRAVTHLRELGVVRSVRVVSASGGQARLELDMGTGPEGLARMLASARVLEVVEASPADAMPVGEDPFATAPALPALASPPALVLRLLP